MKQYLLYHIFLLALVVATTSCGKPEFYYEIKPSTTQLNFTAEGGTKIITFPDGDWCVAGVLYKDGSTQQFGKLYNEEGTFLGDNQILKLDRYGRIESQSDNHGYSIVRNTPLALTVEMKENYTNQTLCYFIRLQSGEIFKDIAIEQAPSNGYKFKNIAFEMKEGDGDSIYKVRVTGYTITVSTPRDWPFYPLYNAHTKSFFASSQPYAFEWTNNDSVKVNLPHEISNGKVIIGSEQSHYNPLLSTRPSGVENREHSIMLEPGTTKAEFYAHYRTRKLSYTVTLTNRKTGTEKTFTGRWVEERPTGEWDVTITPPTKNSNQ